jgi:hypothetical protein
MTGNIRNKSRKRSGGNTKSKSQKLARFAEITRRRGAAKSRKKARTFGTPFAKSVTAARAARS